MIWIAALLGLFALLAAIPKTPTWLPGPVVPVYFMVCLSGQMFALLGMLVALALAVIADGTAAWALAFVAALFALAHWRNRLAGRLLLDTVGLTQTKIPLLAGLWPPRVGDSRVRRIRDVAYGDNGERNLLDIVLPHDPPSAPMPILIQVHGGAWVMGNKDQQGKPLLNHLVPKGWLGIDISYRLGPVHRFPAMIIDVLKAIAWVKAHAHEHGGDPTRIAITGGSAGGHLAALAALVHDDPAFKPGFESAACSVAFAVPIYGRFDLLDRKTYMKGAHKVTIDDFMANKVLPGHVETCPELWRALSPIDRIRPDAPPMFITHGTGDTMLPFEDGRDFALALREISPAPVVFVELPGIEHAYDMAATTLTWAHVRAVERFLQPLAAGSAQPDEAGVALRGERTLAAAGAAAG